MSESRQAVDSTVTPAQPSPNGAKPIDEALKLPSGQIGPLTMSAGLTNIPDPQKHAQLGLRYMSSPAEHAICTYRAANGWDHARPMSVLVCVIGNHYRERSWARIVDMVDFANREGIYCSLMEIQDRCMKPYDALGTMRNEAIINARQGWEWMCMVDADVLPPPDTLVKMLKRADDRGHSILVPYVDEPGTGKRLHGPEREKFSGIWRVRWAVLSFLLFRTSVFSAWPGGEFWDNAIGSDEGYHFKKLYDMGHTMAIDTDCVVPTQSAPTYPLTAKHLSPEDEKKFWAMKEAHRMAPPDRRPLTPDDPRQQNGIYLPHMKPPCPKCKKEMQDIRLPDGITYKCKACDAKPPETPQPPAQEVKPVAAPA